MIVWLLRHNTLRFKELTSALSPITNKTLTIKLRELELAHIIERTIYAEVPPRVEYSLAPQGVALEPVIDEILAWSQGYAHQFAQTKEES